MFSLASLGYVAGAGTAFMLANIAMKCAGHISMPVVASMVFVFAVIGVYFEIEALRITKLGSGVALILALEILLSAGVAYLFFAERYTLVELGGMAFLICGMGLLMQGGAEKQAVAAELAEPAMINPAE